MKLSVIAALLTAAVVASPVAFAQTTKAPATKADCEKAKDMRWDDKAEGGKGACVKK
jgi:hypothetical protein